MIPKTNLYEKLKMARPLSSYYQKKNHIPRDSRKSAEKIYACKKNDGSTIVNNYNIIVSSPSKN